MLAALILVQEHAAEAGPSGPFSVNPGLILWTWVVFIILMLVLKKVAAEYITKYEAKYGKDSRTTFGGHAWDASMLLERAIPEALKKGQPGTREFRVALRDALEGVKEAVGTHGVFTMTATDHLGFDSRARVMLQIVDGKWQLEK